MFFSCALTDFLGRPSVPWLLSPSVLPEEGAFCFQRRRAITAGSTSPDVSLGEGICLRATSVPCHELAKILSPEGQPHFKREPSSYFRKGEMPAHPSSEAHRLSWPLEWWKVGTFRMHCKMLLVFSVPWRVQDAEGLWGWWDIFVCHLTDVCCHVERVCYSFLYSLYSFRNSKSSESGIGAFPAFT